MTEKTDTVRQRYEFPIEHARTTSGQCQAWCYACERAGLQARIEFTKDYESLQFRLTARDNILLALVAQWRKVGWVTHGSAKAECADQLEEALKK